MSPARALLDRQRIVTAALALVDRHGIGQLSMRNIAAALDVEAMALYHHYRNKAELMQSLADFLLDLLEDSLLSEGPPQQRIRHVFETLRALAQAHPDLVPTLAHRGQPTARALDFHRRLHPLFQDAGLDAEQCLRYYTLLWQHTLGAGLQPAGLGPEATRCEACFRFGLDLILQALQAESRLYNVQ